MADSPRGKYSRSPSPYRGHSQSRSPPRELSRSRSRSPPLRNRERSPSGSHDRDESVNTGNTLYVTGLSSRITDRDLEHHFSREGKVVGCHLVVEPRTRASRGFAFVTMDTVKDAERCIKYLNQSILEGRYITVEKSRRGRARTPTPGKYLGVVSTRDGRRGERDRYYGGYGRDEYGGGYRRSPPRHSPYRGGRDYSPRRSPHYDSRYRRGRSRSFSPYGYRSPERASFGRAAAPSLPSLVLFFLLFLAPISALHLPAQSLSHRRLASSRRSLSPSFHYANRRPGFVPKRYVLAENGTRPPGNNRNTSHAPPPAPSTNSSASEDHHHRHSQKNRKRNWILGFLSGAIAGIVSGVVLSVLFRLLMNCIRGRYRNPGGPSIFSQKHIKRVEDLAFLEKEDGLAALEVIGRGGCGEVFKAQLPPPDPARPETPGLVIAIKRIMKRTAESAEPTSDEESRMLDRWMRQIRSEIQTVGHIRHRNLLPLLAHLARPDSHLLIYEYMKNGSLEAVLQGVRSGDREMDWAARFKVALGVAAGLEYLHVHHRPAIIHRDLKPANILLDDSMEARIADFGLAKEMPEAHTHVTASKVAGTLGYIAPEYGQTLRFTAKCDVYSFGVILATLVVGRMPSDNFFQETEELSLVRWLRNVMGGADPAAAIDPKLAGNGYEEQMQLVLRIALFCTAEDPKERPSSKEVRTMLAQIKC